MNLDILDNLINNLKESDFIKKFGEELNNYLDDKIEHQNRKTDINQVSILEEMQNENKITTEYRDKMLIARNKILQEYAQKTQDKGDMYYIYDCTKEQYLLTNCENNKSNQIIKLEKVPEGAQIDSVLRMNKNKFELDIQATEEIKIQISEEINKLLKEQERVMEERRIDGHIYEFVEKTNDRICLIDTTKDTGDVFEEFKFLENVFEDAKQGDLFEYSKGQYKKH